MQSRRVLSYMYTQRLPNKLNELLRLTCNPHQIATLTQYHDHIDFQTLCNGHSLQLIMLCFFVSIHPLANQRSVQKLLIRFHLTNRHPFGISSLPPPQKDYLTQHFLMPSSLVDLPPQISGPSDPSLHIVPTLRFTQIDPLMLYFCSLSRYKYSVFVLEKYTDAGGYF